MEAQKTRWLGANSGANTMDNLINGTGRWTDGATEDPEGMGLGSVDRWIQALRKDLELGDQERTFEGLRSEQVFYRIIKRLERDRARGTWMQRLGRTLRMIFSVGLIARR